MEKISVIVPLYNRRQFIRQCAASVMAQTYTDWELIVVDDGSTDNPEDVLSELQERDSRIRVIRKPNGGVSSARNAGLNAATGEYIQFLDSDDTLRSDCLETAWKRLKESGADVAVYGMLTKGVPAHRALHVPSHAVYHLPGQVMQMIQALYSSSCLNSPVNKLWRRGAIADTRFRTEVSWGEDFIFNLEIFPRCKAVCLLPLPLYQVTPGAPLSLSARYDVRGWDDMLAQRAAIRQFGVETGASLEEIRQLFAPYLWSCCRACISKLCLHSALSHREILLSLRKWKASAEVEELMATVRAGDLLDYLLRHRRLLPLVPFGVKLLYINACLRHTARLFIDSVRSCACALRVYVQEQGTGN